MFWHHCAAVAFCPRARTARKFSVRARARGKVEEAQNDGHETTAGARVNATRLCLRGEIEREGRRVVALVARARERRARLRNARANCGSELRPGVLTSRACRTCTSSRRCLPRVCPAPTPTARGYDHNRSKGPIVILPLSRLAPRGVDRQVSSAR